MPQRSPFALALHALALGVLALAAVPAHAAPDAQVLAAATAAEPAVIETLKRMGCRS